MEEKLSKYVKQRGDKEKIGHLRADPSGNRKQRRAAAAQAKKAPAKNR